MAKTLLEIYRALTSEATNVFRAQAAGLGAAPAAPKPKPVDTKAQNIGPRPSVSSAPSVNAATGGASPTDNQRQAGMSIGNVRDAMYGKNPTAKAASGSTVNTGASGAGPVPNAERPRAAAPVPNKGMSNSPLNQTGGASAAASAYSANKSTQNSGPKRPPPGGFLSPQAAMKAGQNFNIGTTGGVVSRPAAPGKTPTLDRTIPKSPVYPNKGMAGSPLDQTQGAKPEVGRDYRLNKMRQNPPALDTKRDASLDSPNEKSPMARATNPNIGGAGGGDYKSAQRPSVVSTGNPNAAGGTAPVKSGTPPVPKAKPSSAPAAKQNAAPAPTKKVTKVVPKANVPVRQKLQSKSQRDDIAGPGGTGKVVGGVKSGKVTGKTITNKPQVVKKAPVGTGRVK